jgi:ubiquinone/menaquinone biosynthesis C-methylase UbiE
MHESESPHIEPEEVFLPLSGARYAAFYALEMDGFSGDILFYQNNIPTASTVLELGCGTGRISRSLSKTARNVTGLDLSQEMLQQAACDSSTSVNYVCMDMCTMAFTEKFDSIIIPYNTPNLLLTKSRIKTCFKQIHSLLQPDGTLLFQVYIPNEKMFKKEEEKHFQFQMFTLPNKKGKLIKETIRSFSRQTNTLQLEERYRIRGTKQNPIKEDFRHTLQLAVFSFEKWLTILRDSNFQIISLFGDYNNRPFNQHNDTILLVKARKHTIHSNQK